MTPPARNRVIFVGACYIDTVLTIPHFPEEDSKLRASSLLRRRGGNCPNAADVSSQLRLWSSDSDNLYQPGLICVFPEKTSDDARLIANSFLNLSGKPDGDKPLLEHCIWRPQHEKAASCYVLQSQKENTRTIVNYNELPEMTFDEFKTAADKRCGDTGCYHFEGSHTVVIGECIKYLRENFPWTKISLEFERPGREGLKELLPEADYVFCSKTWAVSEGSADGKAYLDSLLEGGETREGSVLCCTWGKEGAWAVDRTQGDTIIYSAARLPTEGKVMDTVGAGDTFTAGMLYGLMCKPEWDLQQRLDFANELAGRKVAQEGLRGLGEIALRQHRGIQ